MGYTVAGDPSTVYFRHHLYIFYNVWKNGLLHCFISRPSHCIWGTIDRLLNNINIHFTLQKNKFKFYFLKLGKSLRIVYIIPIFFIFFSLNQYSGSDSRSGSGQVYHLAGSGPGPGSASGHLTGTGIQRKDRDKFVY